jgi:hypothetical protein
LVVVPRVSLFLLKEFLGRATIELNRREDVAVEGDKVVLSSKGKAANRLNRKLRIVLLLELLNGQLGAP